MITTTIINVLRSDTTLVTLLGAANITSTFKFDDTLDKQINVSLAYGETVPFDQTGNTYDGQVNVYVLVKDTLSEAILSIDAITSRVLTLLDIKGTTLDETAIVYWVQKLDAGFTHYDGIHFYEMAITFRFVSSKS